MELKYKYPIPDSVERKVADFKSILSNYPEFKYAVYFAVPKNTKILAMRTGIVYHVKSDSNISFDPMKLVGVPKLSVLETAARLTNFVCVDHGDGTFAEYLPFGKDQIKVEKGQKVRAGQVLGYSGLSGILAQEPYVHVHVYRKEGDRNIISLPIEFSEK